MNSPEGGRVLPTLKEDRLLFMASSFKENLTDFFSGRTYVVCNFILTQSTLSVLENITHYMFLGAGGHLFEMARKLRAEETQAEKFLWTRLSNKQLGVKFRRQHPVYEYVVDFYCHSQRLVIEVDGPVHNTGEAKFDDKVRSQGFEEFQIEVLRFNNEAVLLDIEEVIKKIIWHLDNYQKI